MSNITNYDRLNIITKIIGNQQQYISFLKFSKKFYELDYKNQLLIYLQYPEATKINTFIEWKKDGRNVKKNPRKIFLYGYYREKQQKSIEGQINIEGIENKKRKMTIEYFNNIPYRKTCNYDLSDTYIDKKLKIQETVKNLDNDYSDEEFYEYLISLDLIKDIEFYSELNLYQNISLTIHQICHQIINSRTDFENKMIKKLIGESTGFLVANYFGFDINIYKFNEVEEFNKLKLEDKVNIGTIIQKESKNIINLILERVKNKEQICA